MADLRIADAPEIALEDITGNEKIPTGGYGNSAVTINNLGQFAKSALSLATEEYVANAIGQKEVKITLAGQNLTPVSSNDNVPQTNNTVLNIVHQNLLNKIEWVKNNVAVVTDHQALQNRNVSNTHPSTSISHNVTSNVSIELETIKNDVLRIETESIPELSNQLVGKQDVIVNDVDLIANTTLSPVPSTNSTPLNNALQALMNRGEYRSVHNNLSGRDASNSHPSSSINHRSINQEKINDGLESIQELLGIQNPSSNLRVYVKSYHAGFAKGGGWFTYDSTKSTVNNGVTIFNGWVRDGNPHVINAFNAGCVANADHASYLDHDGMRRITTYIQSLYASGVTEVIVNFGKGEYICQKEAPVSSQFRNLAEDSFRLVSVPNLKLTLNFENSIFTIRSDMRIGTFNRSDMSKYMGSSPFYGNSETIFFSPDHPFVIADINILILNGTSTHNGNVYNHIVGGVYGDNGIQWASNGMYLANVDQLTIDGIHVSHSHSGDGFYIAGRNPSDKINDLNDGRFMNITGLVATKNGRNGISFTGGKNSSWYNCTSYENGLPDHPTASNPRSNLDIEAEASPIRRARFYNFKSNQAGADGVVSAFQDARDVVFYDSEFINKQRSIWIEKPQFKFYNCYFNGSIIGGYATTIEEDRTRYIDCTFEDDVAKNPNMPTASYLIQQNAKNAIFEKCIFNSYLGKLFWVSSTPQGKYTTLKDCVINFYTHVPDSIYGTYEFDGLTIYDKRPDPSVSMSLAISNAFFKDVRILCDTVISGITFSGTNNFDVYPQNLNQYTKTIAGNYQASRFESPVQLMPRYTTSFLYSDASFIKFAYLNAITDLKRNVLYNKGDTFHCTDPNAQNGVSKWVCTTAGYYNTTSWVTNTAYTVNTYVNANGKVYKATVAGTSGTTAPSHSSGTATDGTVTWEYVGVLAVFTAFGTKAVSVANATGTDDTATKLNALITSLRNAGYIQ